MQASEAEPVPQSGAVDLDAATEVEIDWDHEVTTDEYEDFFMSIFSADANAEGMGNGRETTIGGTTTTNTSSTTGVVSDHASTTSAAAADSSTTGVASEHASTTSAAAADRATNNSGAYDGGNRPSPDLATNNSDGGRWW